MQHSSQTREENASQGASAAVHIVTRRTEFSFPNTTYSEFVCTKYCVCAAASLSGILNFTHMTISFSRLIYFTCLHTSFLVQRDHTFILLEYSNFFTPQDILPIQFHTRISNFMFQKSTPTLIFLRFTFIHIQVAFYFLFSGLSNTTLFHKHKLCQQHEAITLSILTLHF